MLAMTSRLALFGAFFTTWHVANCIPKSEFYPFGVANNDTELESNDEGSSEEISFAYGSFTLFQLTHTKAFVNLNGLISFDTDIAYYSNQELSQFSYSLVAGFYADIDTHETGQPDVKHGAIFYRLTNDSTLLKKFKQKVVANFPDAQPFEPRSLLIATWDRVGYYDSRHDKIVSFQIVLAQGRIQSYVEFLYADNEILWTISEGKDPNLPDIHAQIGFICDDGKNQVLPSSGKHEVINITKQSNMKTPGNFLFRVSGDNILAPLDVQAKMAAIKPTATDAADPFAVDVDEDDDAGEYGLGVVAQQGDDEDDEYLYEALDGVHASTAGGLPPAPAPPSPEPDVTSESPEVTTSPLGEPGVTPIDDEKTTVVLAVDSGDIEMTTLDQRVEYTENSMTHPELPVYQNRDGQGYCDNVCNVNAECTSYTSGSCCKCKSGFYGNGITCLPTDEAQRLNGKVYGKLNGMDLPEMDLHTYAETRDGRAYTSISPVQPATGRAFLLLSTLNNVMGWLFAKSASSQTYNGIDLTGGIMNRTTSVHIGDHHLVTLQQEFSGKEDGDHFKLKMYITGTVPEMPENATVNFGEYFEEYNRPMPGVIKSYATSTVTVEATGRTALQYAITVDQTIRYDECTQKPFEKFTISVLKIERSYVYYELNDRIVRYASANVIEGRPENLADPCRNHDCNSPHMTCAAHQNTYRCVCLHGFQMVHTDPADRQATCDDIDECENAAHRCHMNAMCVNTVGGYTCVCKAGFTGTGYNCEYNGRPTGGKTTSAPLRISCPNDITCHQYAICLRYANGTHFCGCETESLGDGYHHCEKPDTPLCSSHVECGPYGACVFSQTLNHYRCECRPPYVGDGRQCVSHGDSCDIAQNCDRNADCVYKENVFGGSYICRCKSGFSGDGYSCTHSRAPLSPSCNTLNTCSSNGICVNTPQGYECKCKLGFKGDGYRCDADPSSAAGHKRCQFQHDCHTSAHCVNRGENDDYFCECLPGFHGDGVTFCESADQCNPGVPSSPSCHANAECRFDDREGAYVCRCRTGFDGDGRRACTRGGAPVPHPAAPVPHPAAPVPHPAAPVPHLAAPTCRDQPDICHRDASCLPDAAARTFRCRCNPGFSGDGQTSCQMQRDLCNGYQICDQNAHCEADARGENRCRCKSGFEGDGLYCRPIPVVQGPDCLTDPNICDSNAECSPEGSRYVCRCKSGFHGSGSRCTAEDYLRHSSLVFTQGMSLVQRGMLQDDVSKQLVIFPHQIAVGVDFDCRRQKLYWSDISGHAIRTSNADGSNLTLVNEKDLDSPEGVAVDYTSGNIYYADSAMDVIGVVRMDGQHKYSLIKEGLVNPRALAIDFIEKKLYYSDWNRERPLIGRLDLDGTNREHFVTDDILLPNGMVVLHRRRELCWVDAGTHRLECINLHGAARRIVYAPISYGFGLAVQNEDLLFWTDWEDKKIHSVSIFGTDHKTYEPAIGSSAKMYGIVVMSEECTHADTRCSNNNGDCPYLCLPDNRGGRRCVCPENVLDPECNALNA